MRVVLSLRAIALGLGFAVSASCGPAGAGPMDAAVDAGPYTGACYVALMGMGYCQLVVEYRGSPTGPTLDRVCASQMGMFRADCPTDGRVGRCTVNNGLSRQVLNYYAPATTDDIQLLCTRAGGTFQAD